MSCYDDLDVTQEQFDRETYDDTEQWGRARKSCETNPAAGSNAGASREGKPSLTARGDRAAQVTTRCANMLRNTARGGSVGASPTASTFQSLPLAEYRKTSVLCSKCKHRRTRWLFSETRFIKWRKCFRCMSDLERVSVALVAEETRKSMRVKSR